ncbi:MAG: LuxR C-terminal-related transcriptional regulator [Micropepsaceae bacterium]
MIFYRTIATLTGNLARASRLQSIWHDLLSAGSSFGFPHLIVVKISGDSLSLLFSTLHDAPVEEKHGIRMLAHNPLLTHARSSDEPFAKGDLADVLRADARAGGLGLPERFATMEAAVVPIYEDEALTGWICFAGDRDSVDRRTLHTLAAASYAGWMHGTAFKRRTLDKQVLTSRQIECLRLVATGRTDDQIGKALGISGRTVRFHIGNAKVKLHVTSRIQAIARLMPADLLHTGPSKPDAD